MRIRDLSIPGALEVTPRQLEDSRGIFLESYRFESGAEAPGYRFEVVQVNTSVSPRHVLRGVHFGGRTSCPIRSST